jgi:hypothetical protein
MHRTGHVLAPRIGGGAVVEHVAHAVHLPSEAGRRQQLVASDRRCHEK